MLFDSVQIVQENNIQEYQESSPPISEPGIERMITQKIEYYYSYCSCRAGPKLADLPLQNVNGDVHTCSSISCAWRSLSCTCSFRCSTCARKSDLSASSCAAAALCSATADSCSRLDQVKDPVYLKYIKVENVLKEHCENFVHVSFHQKAGH